VALSELLSAMSALPAPQREALTLVGAAGFTQEEAAERLGCAIGTIKSRVWRARLALSLLLQPGHSPRSARSPENARDSGRDAQSFAPHHNPEQHGRIGSGP
jgi:RNA polymerase sigma-70 factor (ECF subfamily)